MKNVFVLGYETLCTKQDAMVIVPVICWSKRMLNYQTRCYLDMGYTVHIKKLSSDEVKKLVGGG